MSDSIGRFLESLNQTMDKNMRLPKKTPKINLKPRIGTDISQTWANEKANRMIAKEWKGEREWTITETKEERAKVLWKTFNHSEWRMLAYVSARSRAPYLPCVCVCEFICANKREKRDKSFSCVHTTVSYNELYGNGIFDIIRSAFWSFCFTSAQVSHYILLLCSACVLAVSTSLRNNTNRTKFSKICWQSVCKSSIVH